MYFDEQRLLADEITTLRYAGRTDEAIALCQKAELRFPDNSFFPKLQGDICRQNGRFPQAAQAYLNMLTLLRPHQFSIFATAYRNLEKSAPADFMRSFLEKIQDLLTKGLLSKEIEKDLYSFLGAQLVMDRDFLHFAEQANDDCNIHLIQKKLEQWESEQDIAKIEALAAFKLGSGKTSQSKKIDSFLIQKLEKLGKYDLALSMIEKTQKPYQNKLILVEILRICRKKTDYSFAEKELSIDEEFIDSSDFNLQYELVYYFRAKDRGEELEKTLRRMRGDAVSSIPIARTLYNFYLSLNRFEDAQSIYEHIQQLEQSHAAGRVQRKKKSRTKSFLLKQLESEQAVRQRMEDLVSDQEHNRRMIALRDLLKGLSHELGQPITNIRYAVQFHRRKMRRNMDTPEDLEVLLSDILLQTDRLGTLLSRFSPVVSPKNESGEFSITACAAKVFDDLETRLREQNISCQIDGPSDLILPGDQVQFSQVFYNLILNSMQAIEKDGHIDIAISVSAHHMITITFTDNGPGIPEQNYQKIFEPFFSTKDPTSGNGGEGLGLYIVWNILKMFNGTIRIDKDFQTGTRFIIQIQQSKGGTER